MTTQRKIEIFAGRLSVEDLIVLKKQLAAKKEVTR